MAAPLRDAQSADLGGDIHECSPGLRLPVRENKRHALVATTGDARVKRYPPQDRRPQ
jgi:hypothetical protein